MNKIFCMLHLIVRMKHASDPWLLTAIKRTMAIKLDKAKSRNKRTHLPKILTQTRNYVTSAIECVGMPNVECKFRDSSATGYTGIGKATETCQSSVDLHTINLHFTTPPI